MQTQDPADERDLVSLARSLQATDDPLATMQQAVELAVRQIDGADAATLSVVHRRGRVETPVASEAMARAADELQYELGEGPCLRAIEDDVVVRVPDVERDERWPRWSRAVVERTPYRSMLCHRLFTARDRVGGLNLYAERPDAFDRDDVDHGEALAAHVALAVRSAQQIAGLEAALDSRTVIGQATGILMERFGLDAQQAYNLLTRLSSHGNRRLRDLAEELTTTGTIDGLGS
jgi:transcriptional regulator with GAF, ATPase, and Fis domain